MTRGILTSFTFACLAFAQQSTKPPDTKPADTKQQGKQVEEPPEEDESLIPKECLMNPLEAQTDINTGDYYFKKSKWGAAANRYRDATCWDPGSADAYLKLGEADEKLHNFDGARDAYQKYLTLSPTGKNVANVKKRLAKLPPAKH